MNYYLLKKIERKKDMTKEEFKQMLVENMELYVSVNKDECIGTTISVSIYFGDEKILSSEEEYL